MRTALCILAMCGVMLTALASEMTRFELDFSKGHSAVVSAGQASPLRGNAGIKDGALRLKAGQAIGLSGAMVPYNPLCYQAKDNLPEFSHGRIVVEFTFLRLPAQEDCLVSIWGIRRIGRTKVTGFCYMQIKFTNGSATMAYNEFDSNSPAAKTVRANVPLNSIEIGRRYRTTLKLDGRMRILEVEGFPPKSGKAPWESLEFYPGATEIVVGGAYADSGRKVDPQVELLIHRFLVQENVKEE